MHPFSRQGVEVSGEGGHQGLAFAGFHLGDAALVQDNAAHHLHPVGPQADDTPGGLPAGGERLGQDAIQRLAVGQALFQLRGLGLKLGVGKGLVLLLQGVHFIGDGVDRLQLPLGGSPEQLGKQTHVVKHLSVVIWDCGARRPRRAISLPVPIFLNMTRPGGRVPRITIILVSIPHSPPQKKSKL